MNNVKNVFNYMFLFKTNEMSSELLNCLYPIIKKTPVSLQDDENYKIRKYFASKLL